MEHCGIKGSRSRPVTRWTRCRGCGGGGSGSIPAIEMRGGKEADLGEEMPRYKMG